MKLFSKRICCFLLIAMSVTATANISEAAGFGKLGGKKGKTAGSTTSDSKSNGKLSMDELQSYIKQFNGFYDTIKSITKSWPAIEAIQKGKFTEADLATTLGFNSKGAAKDIATGYLAAAAYSGETEAVKKYISQGADLNYKGKLGTSALFCALVSPSSNKHKIIKQLLENDANANIRFTEEELTPLMIAAMGGIDKGSVEELLKHNADVNATSKNGFTPIILGAAIGTDAQAIKAMLDSGASSTAEVKAGLAAEVIAVLNKNKDVKKLFINAGGAAKKAVGKGLKR